MAFRGKVGFQRKHSKHRDDLISDIYGYYWEWHDDPESKEEVANDLRIYSNQHLEVILQNLRRGVNFERSLEGINIEG